MAKKGDSLCHELVLQILSGLPVKTLSRFKCVHKSWFILINENFQSKYLPSNMLGVFYQAVANEYVSDPAVSHIFHKLMDHPHCNDRTIDGTLGFLPLYSPPQIIDSCNGLLLCRPDRLLEENFWGRHAREVYYVCNPTTKRWDSLPSIPYNRRDISRLAFDPSVSPHYKVFWIKHCNTHSEFHIFSSENRCSRWQRLISIQSIIELDDFGRCSSLFNKGALYLMSCGHNRCHIVRYRLLERTPRTIMLPQGFAGWPHIGILNGKICCADIVGPQLQIWALVEHDHDEATSQWVLNHRITVAHFNGGSRTMTFHPYSEAIFVRTEQGFWHYNFDGRRRWLRSLIADEIPIRPGKALPFTPCYMDVLQHREMKPMKKKMRYYILFAYVKLRRYWILLPILILLCWLEVFLIKKLSKLKRGSGQTST